LSGYDLLNVQETVSTRERTRFGGEYTMSSCARLLRNLREQWPSNNGDRDSSVTGRIWKSLLHGGGPALEFIFVHFVMFRCILNCTPVLHEHGIYF
jgi:hypothetical protein